MHKFANEDVSLGSWFIGLEVEHIDDHNMCCQTPPGNVSKKDGLLFCLCLCSSVQSGERDVPAITEVN